MNYKDKKTENLETDKNSKNESEDEDLKNVKTEDTLESDIDPNHIEKEEILDNSKESSEDEISKLKSKIEDLQEEKLRLLAEMENLRKRSEKEKIDSIKYGSINLARDILSPNDNLSRALNAISIDEKKSDSINNLIDGLKMVQKEFITIISKHGIEKIDSLHKKFDHNFHQAILELEDDKFEEGTVIQEIQTGFIMHDRLLRPSMVGVSKKTEKKPEKKKKI